MTESLNDVLTCGNEDEAAYQAISWLDNAFSAGRFLQADQELRNVRFGDLHPAVIVALVSMACHAQDHLPSWKEISVAVRQALTEKVGEERATRLLRFRLDVKPKR